MTIRGATAGGGLRDVMVSHIGPLILARLSLCPASQGLTLLSCLSCLDGNLMKGRLPSDWQDKDALSSLVVSSLNLACLKGLFHGSNLPFHHAHA